MPEINLDFKKPTLPKLPKLPELNIDFKKNKVYEQNNVEYSTEDIDIIENVLPYRKDAKFDCMFHTDEGFVNGRWAKGETTARNEKRFVTEMQQGKINYKEDGLNQILDVLTIENIDDTLYPNTKFINCTMKKDVSRV